MATILDDLEPPRRAKFAAVIYANAELLVQYSPSTGHTDFSVVDGLSADIAPHDIPQLIRFLLDVHVHNEVEQLRKRVNAVLDLVEHDPFRR